MAEGFLPPLIAEVRANISEFSARMAEARGEIHKTAAEGSSKFNSMATVGKAALFGIGAAAVGLGTEAIHLADTWEKSHARLVAAVTASGKSFDSFKPQISATDKAMERLGFTNAQTEEALAHATIAMQDPAKAMKEMALAADLARFKNVDLATATDVVDKALAGNLKGLKSMGIDLPIAATNALKMKTAQEAVGKAHEAVTALLAKHSDALNVGSKYHAQYEAAIGKVTDAQDKLSNSQAAGGQIIDALTQRLGGQASAHAETFAGKMEVLKAQSEDLGKNIGLRLIPVVEKLISVTMDVVQWFEKHKAAAIALGVVVGTALVAAVVAYVASMAAAAAATIAATWPIIAIVAAVAAVVAAIVFLWTHWNQVWTWIKSHPAYAALIAVIFPITGVLMAVVGAAKFLAANWQPIWHGIQTVVEDVWKVLQPILHAIGTGVQDVTKGIGLLGKAAGFVANPGGAIAQALGFADGGPVPGPPGAPQLAIVHGGEYVLSQSMLAGGSSVPFSTGGGDVTINVYPSPGMDERTLAASVQAELLKYKRNNVSAGLR